MKRSNVAMDVKRGQAARSYRRPMIRILSDRKNQQIDRMVLRPVHAIMVGVPIGLAFWITFGILYFVEL